MGETLDGVTDGDNLPVSLTVTETGVVVHGNPLEVTRYVERVRRHVATVERAEVVHLADSAAAVTALGSVLAASGDYVQLSPRSLRLLADNGAIPGQTPDTSMALRATASISRATSNSSRSVSQ